MKIQRSATSRLVSIIQGLSAVRARDLAKCRIHPEVLKRAAHGGLIAKIRRGIYTRLDLAMDIERQILSAVNWVPHEVAAARRRLIEAIPCVRYQYKTYVSVYFRLVKSVTRSYTPSPLLA
jgi:hypothetical protein